MSGINNYSEPWLLRFTPDKATRIRVLMDNWRYFSIKPSIPSINLSGGRMALADFYFMPANRTGRILRSQTPEHIEPVAASWRGGSWHFDIEDRMIVI